MATNSLPATPPSTPSGPAPFGARTAIVDNPPNAGRTMEALRDLGYDSYSSVLDITDNSVDAGARHITIEAHEQKGDIVISLSDDGCGMGEEMLAEALRLGSDAERESTDLGKF